MHWRIHFIIKKLASASPPTPAPPTHTASTFRSVPQEENRRKNAGAYASWNAAGGHLEEARVGTPLHSWIHLYRLHSSGRDCQPGSIQDWKTRTSQC